MSNEAAENAVSHLPYATPPATTDLNVVRQEDGIHIDLGPPPLSLLLASIVPPTLILAVSLALVACHWIGHNWNWGFGAPLISISVPCLSYILMLCWYRNIPRSVGVAEGMLYYSDAGTGGAPTGIKSREVSELRVFRSWWRPWIFELTTLPPAKFLSIYTSSPVVILTGSDWRFLDRVRWELSNALGLTILSGPSTPEAPRIRWSR